MIKNQKIKTILLLTATLLMISQTVFATDKKTEPKSTVNAPNIDNLLYKFETEGTDNPTTTDYIASLPDDDAGFILGQITYYALVVTNILAFISFLVAGIFMIISQGNDENLTKAKSILTYTVLAMAIAAVSLAIVTGVTHLNFFHP
ncbi:hypothetical protein J7J83_04110 [bacterium]|nr:hypothetical protein [bacterium]